MSSRLVAVVGAGGFVGRHLAPELVGAGYAVRRLARNPVTLDALAGVEDFQVDLEDGYGLDAALADVDTAVYLVHAMEGGGGFATRDRRYAQRFAEAARAARVRHVVYLGGLYPRNTTLSDHLESRREVGEILRRRCGALHVRAGIIIGAGSASFEIMHDLVRRLPFMVTPRWVQSRCQPVEISDVTATLVRAVEVPGDREVDLAGPDVLTYRAMLERLASLLGLHRRLIVGVPILTPGVSAHWLRFVTAVSLPVARALVESLRHDAVADTGDLCAEVGIRPCGFDEAIRRALSARPGVLNTTVEQSWEGGRYNLTQRFDLTPTLTCDRGFVEAVDGHLQVVSETFCLHALRWIGHDLRMGPWSMMRLGELEVVGGGECGVARAIRGGLLTAAPGGHLVFACRPDLGRSVIEVRLVGYSPRLPRAVHLRVQAPVHRALVTWATRRAAHGDRLAARRPRR